MHTMRPGEIRFRGNDKSTNDNSLMACLLQAFPHHNLSIRDTEGKHSAILAELNWALTELTEEGLIFKRNGRRPSRFQRK